jgi:hypothetical protein
LRVLSFHTKQLEITDSFILEVLAQGVPNPMKTQFAQTQVVVKNSQMRAFHNPEVAIEDLARPEP